MTTRGFPRPGPLDCELRKLRHANGATWIDAQKRSLSFELFDEIVRICVTCASATRETPSAVATLPSPSARVFEPQDDGWVTAVTGSYRLQFHPQHGSLRFSTADGSELLSSGESSAFLCAPDDGVWFRIQMSPQTKIFGLGPKTGGLNKRGRRWRMENREPVGVGLNKDPLYQSHPFMLVTGESSSYGLFFDCVSHSVFDLGKSDAEQALVGCQQPVVSLFLIAGPEPKDVIRRYTGLVGRTPLPPRWALGYHQCRWSYASDREVEKIAADMDRFQIPCDAVSLDIGHLDGYRTFTWHPRRFPDPARLIRKLAARNMKAVAVVEPGVKVEPSYCVYREGVERDRFLKRANGKEYRGNSWPGTVAFPDLTRREVRRWWASLHEGLLSQGVAGIWNDMNEPAWWIPGPTINTFLRPWMKPDDVVFEPETGAVPFKQVHNLYANLEAEATHEAFAAFANNRRPFVLSRAGFAGIQRLAAVFTGDVSSRWPHLAQSIPMLCNMGLSGITFCGADIGGFFLSCRAELFARWMQLGALYPYCRNHSMKYSRRQEPWAFGDRITRIARQALELRYRLMPLLYSLFWQASREGLPVMRPMLLEFPHDETALRCEDQFMLGPDLLVAPVLEQGTRRRPVYFPEGTWFELDGPGLWQGPCWHTVEAPLDKLPLFVRGGGVLPNWPLRRRAAGPPATELRLRCFPCAERTGRMQLYDDAGDGFEYQRGEYTLVPFSLRRDGDRIELARGVQEGTLRHAWQKLTIEVRSAASPRQVLLEKEMDAPLLELPWRHDGNAIVTDFEPPNRPWRLSLSL